ncbi:MAG: DinB family protein [Acidobacteriia bacterium]|nr:DinB family protein [Terriglobia bacterium]
MRTLLTMIACTALCGGLLQAQNPMSADVKQMFDSISGNVLKAAEKMPEAEYGFQPTAEVRTFARLIGHVADAQTSFCTAALGDRKASQIEKTKTTKADLVQALKDSIAVCGDAYGKLTDASAVEAVKFGNRDRTRMWVLAFNASHSNEHYGNLVTYMRIKGLVPPSSEGR